MPIISETIELLGYQATDKVTGFTGVVASVSFDLYGCVQVVLTPPMTDNKQGDSHYFDVSRLTISRKKRVMTPKDFDAGSKTLETYDSGPADKPALSRL